VERSRVDDDAVVRFVVRDSGIRISSGKVDKIFEPFAQEDQTTTLNKGGTGLGRTISKHLCQLMGGDISLDSIEGKGSTFYAPTLKDLGTTAFIGIHTVIALGRCWGRSSDESLPDDPSSQRRRFVSRLRSLLKHTLEKGLHVLPGILIGLCMIT